MLLSRYERMIARRYLLPGRGEAFIALVAGISLVAVMLGVAALVVVMSVMNGFRAELFEAHPRRHHRHAADRESADDQLQRPRRRGAGPWHARRRYPRQRHAERQGDHRVAQPPDARQRHGRDRVAAGGVARRDRRQRDPADQSRGPRVADGHGAADRQLPRGCDFRGRHLRFRQALRRHADRGRADIAADGTGSARSSPRWSKPSDAAARSPTGAR